MEVSTVQKNGFAQDSSKTNTGESTHESSGIFGSKSIVMKL